MVSFTLNDAPAVYEGDDDKPLLWVIREDKGLKGTKFGCGIGQCGACTVHVNDQAVRSCSFPAAALQDGDVVRTIEGLASGDNLHPVQEAWVEEDVAQCGYCQAGQIMAVAALLQEIPNPSDEDINRRHDNLCRCGSYFRMRKAIHRAASLMGGRDENQ